MRGHFAHYYRPSAVELGDIWRRATFALDANVLLNLYRYTVSTREELLAVLAASQDRLWVPHQAAYEYFENRFEVVQLQRRRFEGARGELKKARSVLDQLYTSPVKEGAERRDKAERAWVELASYIDAGAAEAIAPTAEVGDDPVLSALTDLLDGRVGEPFSHDRHAAIVKDAATRFASRVPPGYADAAKPGDSKYGDVVLWMQLLDHARETGAPVIFVTDDVKEDWWSISAGQTLGPRPALLQEMMAVAGQPFWMYRAAAFMQQAGATSDRSPSGSAIEEVEDLRPLAQDPAFGPLPTLVPQVAEYVKERRSAIRASKSRHELELAALDAEYATETDRTARDRMVSQRRAIIRGLEAQDIELMRLIEFEEAAPAAFGGGSQTATFYEAPGVARDAALAVWSVPGYTERVAEPKPARAEELAEATDAGESPA